MATTSTSTETSASPSSSLPPPSTCNFKGCDLKADKRCSQCKAVSYCSGDHQKQDWSTHKKTCKPASTPSPPVPPSAPKVPKPKAEALAPGFISNAGSKIPKSVRAMKVYCQGEVIPEEWNKPRETFQFITIQGNDAIFSSEPCEVTTLFGFPLLMRKVAQDLNPEDQSFSNPQARALALDPLTGEAKSGWKKGVGSIIVCRADRAPISPYQFEACWKYALSLMDLYSFSRGKTIPATVKPKLSRTAFEEYYKVLRRENVREYKWEKSPKTLEGEEIALEGRDEVNKLDGEWNKEKEGGYTYKKDAQGKWGTGGSTKGNNDFDEDFE